MAAGIGAAGGGAAAAGVGVGVGVERKKGAETCVYLGLMDGGIQKHILGEIF